MKGRPGGIPPRGWTPLAAVSALAIAGACDAGPSLSHRPLQDPAHRQRAAGLRSARDLLQEGRTHDARLSLRALLEARDSRQARALWWSSGLSAAGGHVAAATPRPHPTALKVCMLGGGAVTGHVDGTLRHWDLSTGRSTALAGGLRGPVGALACSPAGAVAAGGDEPGVWVWDDYAKTPKARPRRLSTGQAAVRRLAFHPYMRILAAALDDATVGHWDHRSGEELGRLRGHRGRQPGLAFSGDGQRMATWGEERSVRIHLWGREELPRKLDGAQRPIRAAAFLPAGRALVTTGDDGGVFLWDLHAGIARPRRLGGHPGESWAIAVHPDGDHAATADSDGKVRLWPLDGAAPRVLTGHAGPVRDLAFSGDGRTLVSVGQAGGVRTWEGRSGAPLTLAQVTPLRTSVAQGGWPACTLSWPDRVELRPSLHAPPNVVVDLPGVRDLTATDKGCAALALDGVHLLTPDGRTRRLHRHASAMTWTGAELAIADADSPRGDHAGVVTALAMSTDGPIYGLDSGTVLMPPEHRPLHTTALPSEVTRVVKGPAGIVAAAFAAGEVVVWDGATGHELAALALHGRPTDLRVEENRRLVVATDLGAHDLLDLSPLVLPRCALLERVWASLPSPPPPAGHVCRPPA